MLQDDVQPAESQFKTHAMTTKPLKALMLLSQIPFSEAGIVIL